jgi:hypothetical protein
VDIEDGGVSGVAYGDMLEFAPGDTPRYVEKPGTRIKALYFSDDWEHSNGCAFEFSVASDAGISTFAAAGRPLTREEGCRRLEAAARAGGGGFRRVRIARGEREAYGSEIPRSWQIFRTRKSLISV